MSTFLFTLLILFSLFSRFYGLSWGEEFFFHPDERNIASSVSQLNLPDKLNPHFFAYGGLPIYVIYFTGVLLNFLSQSSIFHVSFEQAILTSRFYSALLSVLTVIFMYVVVRRLKGEREAVFATFLSATSVGLIQFAHFGTFEMWLTSFSLLLFYFCLRIAESGSIKYIAFAGIMLGLLVSTKVSSLALFPLPLIAIFLYYLLKKPHRKSACISVIVFCMLTTVVIFLITSPFAFFDFQSFRSVIMYESAVALGKLPVFYTGEFFATFPIFFQFSDVYPFLLNPLLAIIFVPAFFYTLYQSVRTRNISYLLLVICYLLLFLSQAFFFTKWVRYMVPTLPFAYIILALAIFDFLKFLPKARYGLFSGVVFLSALFALSYFVTVYTKIDTRIEASLWARDNIPKEAQIVSEVYDLGITPFNRYLSNITLFNFYDLDNNAITSGPSALTSLLLQTDYIVLSSQRILKVRLINSNTFPNGQRFYQALVSGKLGFEKIYETPCTIFCRITYLGDPVFTFEQTASVFDRPTAFIFKKVR